MDIIVLYQFLTIYNYPPFPIILLHVLFLMPRHAEDDVVARVGTIKLVQYWWCDICMLASRIALALRSVVSDFECSTVIDVKFKFWNNFGCFSINPSEMIFDEHPSSANAEARIPFMVPLSRKSFLIGTVSPFFATLWFRSLCVPACFWLKDLLNFPMLHYCF